MPRLKWKKGWKVIMAATRVSCSNGMYRSVEYKKNKIVGRPKDCGPLAVFNTREAARNFAKRHLGYPRSRKIVKCLYKKSKHSRLWVGALFSLFNLPEGTVLADKVKCLE